MLARITLVTLFAAASAIVATSAARQAPAPAVTAPGDWPSYGRDLGNSRYSPLDQITRDNVATLRVAWRWKSDNFSIPAEYRNESTPIMVNRTLYFTAGATR